LIANFDVREGKSWRLPSDKQDGKNDFAGHIAHTIANHPEAPWLFIVDQLKMHNSEALVSSSPTLGIKGSRQKETGFASMPTRAVSS